MPLFPKSPDFFTLFDQIATVLESAGRLLSKIEIPEKSKDSSAKKIRGLEMEADSLSHTILQEANTSLITSIDREDIYALSGSLDNVIDYIENFTSSISLYDLKKEERHYKKYTRLLSECTIDVARLVKLLRYKEKKIPEMKKLIIEINRLENEGDDVIRDGLKDLFSKHANDPVYIIKWKDLYQNMEEVLDECERAALIVEEIIVKNF